MDTPYTVADTAPDLIGTVNADLSLAAVEVHIARPDSTIISHPATVTDALGGAWSMALVDGDLNESGVYRVEVQVTFGSSKIQTFAFDAEGRANTFTVRDQIG